MTCNLLIKNLGQEQNAILAVFLKSCFCHLNNILELLTRLAFCLRASVICIANVCVSIVCMDYFQTQGWDRKRPFNRISTVLFIYLLLVKTNGVAFLEPFSRARDCSFPSFPDSPPLPEKGQTPLALDPLPPILRDKA